MHCGWRPCRKAFSASIHARAPSSSSMPSSAPRIRSATTASTPFTSTARARCGRRPSAGWASSILRRHVQSYDSRAGLPADTVLGILEEDDGRLWVSTPNGLSRFDPRTETFTNYHALGRSVRPISFRRPWSPARARAGRCSPARRRGSWRSSPGRSSSAARASGVLADFRLFGEPVQPGSGPLDAADLVRDFAGPGVAQHRVVRTSLP